MPEQSSLPESRGGGHAEPPLFPIFIKLADRVCLVAGAGAVGEAKIRSLLEAGARVRVVAPKAGAAASEWARSGAISWNEREFQTDDLNGVFLVIAATSSPAVNAAIFHEAQARHILCNSVDDPIHCDFYYPSVVRRGALQLAISTAGLSPALAQRLRRELEAQFGQEYSAWVDDLGAARRQLFARDLDPEQRRQTLHNLASRESFEKARRDRLGAKGKVFLVGAGPGDPELLTLKALRVLKSADVVLHDGLIGAEVMALIPSTAQTHNVGKQAGKKCIRQEEINRLLVQLALLGLRVVRLKGGDPLVFGRAGEEIEALRKAGVEIEIVPGVTAALASAAAARIPLSHRDIASSMIILSGHQSENANHRDWPERLPRDSTVVVYMPGPAYNAISRKLQEAGLAPETPCAVISRASTPEEEVFRTTLAGLKSSRRLPAPTLLVAGEVVRLANHATLRRQLAWAAPELTNDLLSKSTELPAGPGSEEHTR